MLRISRNLPTCCKPALRATASTGNLQLRALTSPAAAALKEYSHHHHHHHHHEKKTNHSPRLQNRAVHVHVQPAAFEPPISAVFPPPRALPTSSRPVTSANVFLSSLQRGGIDTTPSGTAALSQILSAVPYTAITTHWLKAVESSLVASHMMTNSHGKGRPQVLLQPLSSNMVWTEWVKYQVDRLAERFVAMEGWGGLWEFEYLLMDEGLVVRGDEEVRRILEVLVRNGWVVPVEEEEGGDVGGYRYEVVVPGRVGRFEGDKFAF